MSTTRGLSTPVERIDELFSLLKDQGNGDYIGESISQLLPTTFQEHCLQAAHFAASAHADPNTIMAALLHDVGQFVPDLETQALQVTILYAGENVGKCGHEKIGADYLRHLGFNEKVCGLVEAHVIAKRYYYSIGNGVFDTELWTVSLVLQGGSFSSLEVREFEQDSIWKEKVQLRKWDDTAKIVGLETPGAKEIELETKVTLVVSPEERLG
ncbi:hypothetical protein BU17DRAFT_60209 [Hysterangium stoloniferum]|nr:hypothetical protein BU17DRAFT_60209 [Hysterangium stoloniferum]